MKRWEAVRRLLQYCLNDKLLQEEITALKEHFNRELSLHPLSLRALIENVVTLIPDGSGYKLADVFDFDPTTLKVIKPCPHRDDFNPLFPWPFDLSICSVYLFDYRFLPVAPSLARSLSLSLSLSLARSLALSIYLSLALSLARSLSRALSVAHALEGLALQVPRQQRGSRHAAGLCRGCCSWVEAVPSYWADPPSSEPGLGLVCELRCASG
jgi:hypothetical protein